MPSAIGGGFGGKLDLSVQPLLAVAAWKLGRPVRLVYERPESMQSSTKRHPATMQATLACDAAGRLVAYDFAGDFNTGAYSSWGPTVANRVPIHASGPYRVDHVRALTRAVLHQRQHRRRVPRLRRAAVDAASASCSSTSSPGARSSIRSSSATSTRCVAGDTTPTGQVLAASVGLRACLDALAAGMDGARAPRRRVQRERRTASSPLRRGAGIACMWYGIGNTVIANPSTMRGALRWSAARGAHLFLYNGAQEIGQGTATVMPQMFADAVGLPLASVEQVMGDTDLTADAGKSSASRQTFVSGNAAKGAGESLRARMLEALGLADVAVRRCASASRRRPSHGDASRRPVRPRPARARTATRTATSSSPAATSIRRPCRSTPTARACPTRPTASRRRSPRSRSTSSSAR